MIATSNSSSQEAARWSLAGATALVTGGSKGIGRAIVGELASFGAAVHTCARNEAGLNRCLEEWNAKNLAVTRSVCDVSVRADREALAGRVAAMLNGKLDILVNNVGLFYLKPAVKVTPEEFSLLMVANVESCFHLSQLLHPFLKASGKGNIINISGISTITGFPTLPICAFSTAKGAMNQITKSLAVEWASDNIRVNCIAPGIIDTPLGDDIRCDFITKLQSKSGKNPHLEGVSGTDFIQRISHVRRCDV